MSGALPETAATRKTLKARRGWILTHLEIKPSTCTLKVEPLPRALCQCCQSLWNLGEMLLGDLIMFFLLLLNYGQYECRYTCIRSCLWYDFSVSLQFIFNGGEDSKCLSSYLLNYLDKLHSYRVQKARNALNGFILSSEYFLRLHCTVLHCTAQVVTFEEVWTVP